MIEFGKTLRAHREAKGLTTSEVAQKTHILVQQVEALEKEDFSKIAAPIYGRGFVKLYCEAVGIEKALKSSGEGDDSSIEGAVSAAATVFILIVGGLFPEYISMNSSTRGL